MEPDYLLGKITETPMIELIASEKQVQHGQSVAQRPRPGGSDVPDEQHTPAMTGKPLTGILGQSTLDALAAAREWLAQSS